MSMVARSLRLSCGSICNPGLRLDWWWARTILLCTLTAARPYLEIFLIFSTYLDARRHLQLPYILKVSLLGTRGPATCTVSSVVTPDPDIARSTLKSYNFIDKTLVSW